jgi:hypothetical protein
MTDDLELIRLRAQARARQAQGQSHAVSGSAGGELPSVAEQRRQKALEFYGDENPNVLMQALGGAKHALDRPAEVLSRLGSDESNQKMKDLVSQGKAFVQETGPASSLGNFAGEVGVTMLPSGAAYRGAKGLTQLAGTGMLPRSVGTVVGGGAAGATGAGMMGGDPVHGAILGAAVSPLFAGAGKATDLTNKFGTRLFSGAKGETTYKLREMFPEAGERAAVVSALRKVTSGVPGVRPLADEVAGANPNQLFPKMKELGVSARANPDVGARIVQQDMDNQIARANLMDEMAAPGRPGFNELTGKPTRSAFQEIREVATRPFYDAADPRMVRLNSDLTAMLDAAQVLPATRAAGRGAAQARANAQAGRTPVPPGAQRNPDNTSDYSIRDLQGIKDQLSNQIRQMQKGGSVSDPAKLANLQQARRLLTERMEKVADYREANQLFRELSPPQNQAEIADYLAQTLRSPQGVMNPNQTQWLGAQKDAAQTIRKAGGDPRYSDLREIMTPDQMGSINAITDDMVRLQRLKDLQTAPQMVPETQSAAERVTEKVPGLISRVVTTIKKAGKLMSGRTDEEVDRIISEAMMDPRKMADLISRATPDEKAILRNLIRDNSDMIQGGAIGYGTAPGYTEDEE